jgi:acetyl/propionyl-CoA carboxylase alpha subunit
VPRTALPALWDGWSSSSALDTMVPIEIDGATHAWHLAGERTSFHARCGGATHRIVGLTAARDGDDLRLDASVDGRAVRVDARIDATGGHWQSEGAELAATDLRLRGAAGPAAAASGVLVAPLHGRVTQTCVAAGEVVAAGALLVVIEAMKMEHQIRAPHAGTVTSLHVRAGDQVAVRQTLAEVRP